MDWRTEALGGYERQLADRDIPLGVRLMIGPDHIGAWNNAPASYDITAASTGAGTFTIAGDYEIRFKWPNESIPCQFYVRGSTGNDNGGQLYTVANAVYAAGETVITVTGSVASAVADGEIVLYQALTLPVAFDHPLLPTKGLMPGARGETLDWDRPAMLKPELEVKVYDWDQAVHDQLALWLSLRQRLRFWLALDFTAIGYIGGIPIARPQSKELVVTLLLKGMRRYNAGAVSSPATVQHHATTDSVAKVCNVLQTPFIVGTSDVTEWTRRTILHGQEVYG